MGAICSPRAQGTLRPGAEPQRSRERSLVATPLSCVQEEAAPGVHEGDAAACTLSHGVLACAAAPEHRAPRQPRRPEEAWRPTRTVTVRICAPCMRVSSLLLYACVLPCMRVPYWGVCGRCPVTAQRLRVGGGGARRSCFTTLVNPQRAARAPVPLALPALSPAARSGPCARLRARGLDLDLDLSSWLKILPK